MMEVPERDLVSVASAVEEAVDRYKSTHRLLLDRLMRKAERAFLLAALC